MPLNVFHCIIKGMGIHKIDKHTIANVRSHICIQKHINTIKQMQTTLAFAALVIFAFEHVQMYVQLRKLSGYMYYIYSLSLPPSLPLYLEVVLEVD